MCKDKNYYNLQKKKLSKKKKFSFKLEKKLKVLNAFNMLRQAKLLIFLQYRSLIADRDLRLNLFFLDKNYLFKIITKNSIKKIIAENFKRKKNFSAFLCLASLGEKSDLEKILKKHNIGILGYYFNNFFFYKKDFNIINISHKMALNVICDVKNTFIKKLLTIVILLQKFLIRLYWILQLKKEHDHN